MLLAWVAAIPPAGSPRPPDRRFLRVLLPLLAVAETLQVYPVPGSQVGIAAVFFVPVGALCLADAWSTCAPGARPRRRRPPANFATTVTAARDRPAGALMRSTRSSCRGQQRLHLPRAGQAAAAGSRTAAPPGAAGRSLRTAGRAAPQEPLHDVRRLPEHQQPLLLVRAGSAAADAPQRLGLRAGRRTAASGGARTQGLAAALRDPQRRTGGALSERPAGAGNAAGRLRDNNFKPAYEVGGYVFELPLPSATDGEG